MKSEWLGNSKSAMYLPAISMSETSYQYLLPRTTIFFVSLFLYNKFNWYSKFCFLKSEKNFVGGSHQKINPILGWFLRFFAGGLLKGVFRIPFDMYNGTILKK